MMMPGSGRFLRSERGRYKLKSPHLAAGACFHYSWTQAPVPRPRRRARLRARCQSAPRIMDSHSRSASPGGRARPQHRPPSPPTPPGVDNRAFTPDDPNHNDSFASNHPHQNGHSKEHNGDTKTLEAVNLELINLQPRNGNTKKKDVEVDMNVTNPYDEYFVPVNEHRKYMRGEKLYVTADKRGEKGGCKRPLCWTLLGLVVAAVVALIALAATGVLFANSPTPVEQYNASVSSARALGGIGQARHHDHDHDHDHDHAHDHTHHYHHAAHKPDEPHHLGDDQDETTTHGGDDEYPGFENSNDSSMYVPRVIEGELKIDSEELPATLFDPGSYEYKQFIEDVSKALKEAIFGMNAADDNGSDIVVEFAQPRKEPGLVMYRILWKSELNNDSANLLTPDELKADLEKYLTKHNRMINVYHFTKEGIKARRVLDLCQVNKNNCEYGCEFDESTLDFTCTCPPSQMVDITNPHRCISTLEPNAGDNTKQKPNHVLNSDADRRPEEENQSTHSEGNIYGWKEMNSVRLETTTARDPDLKFSHIFGHENNGEDEQNNSSTEDKDKPVLNQEPEPTSEPEPEPSSDSSPEPTSEPKPEPASGPEPTSEPEPVPSSEQEPMPSSTPEPVPSSKPEPVLSLSLEPVTTAEPEPELSSEPEPAPVPDTNLKEERKTLSEPEPEPTPKPEPEPVSEPVSEPNPKPQTNIDSIPSEPPSTPEPEPTSEPTSKTPVTEPTPEPKLVVGHEYSPEPRPATELNRILLHSGENPSTEVSTTPESIAKPKLGIELTNTTKTDTELNPEPKNEHNTEMDPKNELTTEFTTSSHVTNSITEPGQILFGQEKDNETELAHAKLIPQTVLDILNLDSNQTQVSKSAPPHEPQSKPVLTVTEANLDESPTESIPEANILYEFKEVSSTEENNTEKTIEHEYISEPKNIVESIHSDESTDAAHVLLSPSNDSEELKTNYNDKNDDTTTEPLFETNPIESILHQNQGNLNSDNDWLSENNNISNNETEQIHLAGLSSTSRVDTAEDEMSFDFIAKNNEVPSEVDEEDAKTTPVPAVYMQADSANIAVTNLNKLANTIENKNHSELQGTQNINHPLTEESFPTKSSEITENDHQIKSFNKQNTTRTNGEEDTTEPFGNSDVSFDFINALYNRSSKSFNEEQNNTNIDHVISNGTIEENTTASNSDWLPVPITEINYTKMFDKMPEGTETTTVNELEDIINPEMTNDDFEPDYLSNIDKTTSRMPEQFIPVFMSHDYNNEEFRVKRVNNYSNNIIQTINTTESSKISSEHIEDTTVSEHFYKTTEITPVSFDANQTSPTKDINESEPAPVWEDSDNDTHLLSKLSAENSTSETIEQTSLNNSTHITTDSSTPVNNFNVTIYEISALNNHSFPVTKPVNAHSSEYDDHETEMNPFLPEIENNKSLVKKLQEGHDLEPNSLNDKQNENNEDHSLATERQINDKNNKTENINEYTTVEPDVTFSMYQNVHVNSSEALDVKNKTINNLSDKTAKDSQEDIQSISTFLIDTDDLDRERTTVPSPVVVKKYLDSNASSPTSLAEKTTESTSTQSDDSNNMEFLSVVPLNDKDEEQMPNNNIKSENILELNDIRTLDLTK